MQADSKQALFHEIKEKAIVDSVAGKLDHSAYSKGVAPSKNPKTVNIRALTTHSQTLNLLAEVFWQAMGKYFPFQVGGLELGAVPLLSAILMKGDSKGLTVNSFIVRKTRKKSGQCQQIEGAINDQPIVIVDDLINSGYSIQRVWAVLNDYHKVINHVFCYVHFENPAAIDFHNREELHLTYIFKLTDFDLSLPKPQAFYPEQQTLTIAWQFSPTTQANCTLSAPHSKPVVDDKTIYYGGDDGYLYAVNKTNGELSWQLKIGQSEKGILSSPVLYNNSILFGAYDGALYRLHTKDGSVIWESQLAEYIGSSPCIVKSLNRVFIGLEHNVHQKRGELTAIDLETGEKIWGLTVADYIHSSPIYDTSSQTVFVGGNDGKLYAIDADNGQQRWSFATDGAIKVAATLDHKRRQIIVPSFDGNCYGIDIETGKETFRLKAGHAFYTSALIHKDTLYNGSCDKHFYIYDLNKKERVKKLPVMGRILSSPQLIQDSIWFGANDGFIRQIDAEGNYHGGILLSERPLTPIVHDAVLNCYFVVTMGNHLLRLASK